MNRKLQFLGAVLTAGLIAGCSQGLPEPAALRPAYVMTVPIAPDDSPSTLAARYAYPLIAFDASTGDALLGLTKQQATSIRATGAGATSSIEPNYNQFVGSGTLATMGGARTMWAGGLWQAWAGGARTMWAGGTYQPISQNSATLNQIHLQQAQSLAPHLGGGVVVAVIDTGIDLSHPAFDGALTAPTTWKDFYGNDNVPQEEGILGVGGYGHGTSVASIVLQVAPSAKILPIRVLGPDGLGDMSMVAQAVTYAASQGAKVINLSLGSATSSKVVQDAIAKVVGLGVLVVSSAGNENGALTYPAANADDKGPVGDRSVSVSSVNSLDRKSSFSNYGKDLELMAPGENVYSAGPGGLLVAWSGTSMAAPMVSGAFALALGERANLKPNDLAQKVLTSSSSIAALNAGYPADQLGQGRLALDSFLTAAFSAPLP